jgi:hypothetical protein
MVAKNDITGDSIQTKIPSKDYSNNYDNIFRKDKRAEEDARLEDEAFNEVERRIGGIAQLGEQ